MSKKSGPGAAGIERIAAPAMMKPNVVDRVGRVGREHDVAGRGDRLGEIGEPLLRAQSDDHLAVGIELDAEAAGIIAGLGLAQPGDALRRRIAMRARDRARPRRASRSHGRAAPRRDCPCRDRRCPRPAPAPPPSSRSLRRRHRAAGGGCGRNRCSCAKAVPERPSGASLFCAPQRKTRPPQSRDSRDLLLDRDGSKSMTSKSGWTA